MFLIDFKKERTEEILSAINAGGPIPAPPNGWNRYEMLQVAGAMYAAIWSQGPIKPDASLMSDPQKMTDYINSLPPEHREANEETLTEDVHSAIEFCGQLTFMVRDGDYDDYNEPHIQAIGNGNQVQILNGGKNT